MDWIDEAAINLKKKRRLLFSKDSEYLQDLLALFCGQEHRVMVAWGFDFAAGSIIRLKQKYPAEHRPKAALAAAQDWAAGKVKMHFAQRKILDCHAFAKEIDIPEDVAICHAVGQACAIVHTAGHAIGYPIYDLTSIVHKLGIKNCAEAIEQRKQNYIDRLFYWNSYCREHKGKYAAFIEK